MKRSKLSTLLLLLTACTTAIPPETPVLLDPELPAGVEFSPARIEAHMRFLADDLLEGRETDTRGHDIAAAYVASRFEAYGLEPAGTDGFMQPVTLREARVDHDASYLKISSPDFPVQLEGEADYFLSPNIESERVTAGGEVVFVGYGVSAPEHGRDDYAGVDVDGKIVAFYRGGPADLDSTSRAIHSRRSGKLETAQRRGAVGAIELRTPESYESSPWERLLRWKDYPSLEWVSEDGRTGGSLGKLFLARLSPEGTRKLFTHAPKTWEESAESVDRGAGSFPLNVALEAHVESDYAEVSSPNVIGKIPGTDLEQESVLFLAHLDHVGINSRAEDDEDAIHNGAYDNASGVATMLEVARAFSEANERPRRSVIFAAVTAEEKGLIGSDYLANNPTEATSDVVAAISIDMFLMLYPMNDVVGFGGEHSSLGPSLERVAAEMGVHVSPDFAPQQVLFVRTDHYPFVVRGIPGMFLVHGTDASPAENGEEMMWAWMEERYHDVDDDMDQPIDFKVGARFATLNYLLARSIANDPERPSWNPGGLFASE